MTSSYSTDLKLELMVTGENAGLWGDITNTNLVILQQAIAGYQTVTLNATSGATLTFTNGALSNGKNAVLKLQGSINNSVNVILPDGIQKVYLIENATSGTFAVTFKTTSGTGVTWAANDKSTKIVYSNGTNIVDTGTTTPIITQINDTNVNEQIKFTTTENAVNEITIANAATATNPIISATGSDTNIGLTLTPKGIARVIANGNAKIFGVAENVTISSIFQTTLNYNTNTQAVYYSTGAATSNFTVNLRGDASNSLNASLAVGESVTVALLSAQNNTTYYNNVIQVDGTNVTAIWQGGIAPVTGYTSSTDVYTYTVIKTASSTYTVLASQTQFK